MFNIGDLVIYSTHGICKVDNICDKTFSGITRTYYVLHPMEDHHQLTISTPVNNNKVLMLDLIHKEEAHDILESFRDPGIKWYDHSNIRLNLYTEIINTGDRKEIAKVVNTLMRKKLELQLLDRKFYERDQRLLNTTVNILFKELAISLETTFEDIHEIVMEAIK